MPAGTDSVQYAAMRITLCNGIAYLARENS